MLCIYQSNLVVIMMSSLTCRSTLWLSINTLNNNSCLFSILDFPFHFFLNLYFQRKLIMSHIQLSLQKLNLPFLSLMILLQE